jgi:transposase
MDFHLDNLLNLPNVVGDGYTSTLDAIVVKLQLVNAGINCPNCNKYISQVHQTRSVLVRDLSILGQVVYLKVPRRQFYCSTCKKSPTEPLVWVNKKQRQTNRYQEYIHERVKELTVKQVSENEKMSEDAVQDIFHKIASSKKSGCALVGSPDVKSATRQRSYRRN